MSGTTRISDAEWETLSILPPPPAMELIDQLSEQTGTRRKTAEQVKDELLARWRDRIMNIKAMCKGIDLKTAVDITMLTLKDRNERKFNSDMHKWKDDQNNDEREARARAEARAETKAEDMEILITENDKSRAENAENRALLLRAITAMENMSEDVRLLTTKIADNPPALKDESKKDELKKDEPKKI